MEQQIVPGYFQMLDQLDFELPPPFLYRVPGTFMDLIIVYCHNFCKDYLKKYKFFLKSVSAID